MEEIWKDIEDYRGVYQVSSIGRVRRLKRIRENILSCAPNTSGYPTVHLCKNGKRSTKTVHRLIAQAFIPNPENKPQINHKNGIRPDNRLENLEWCTSSENNLHAYRTSKRKVLRGENHGMSKSVFDKSTGNVYESITASSLAIDMKGITVWRMVTGISPNKTNLTLVK